MGYIFLFVLILILLVFFKIKTTREIKNAKKFFKAEKDKIKPPVPNNGQAKEKE